MYLSDMWFGVAPRTNTKETCVLKRFDCVTHNIIIILDSIVNMIAA